MSKSLRVGSILCIAIGWAFAHAAATAPQVSAKDVDPPESPTAATAALASGAMLAHGDQQIRLIPTLSSPSVKNGGKLEIGALIKAKAGVKSVVAEIKDGDRIVDTISLAPKPQPSSTDSVSTLIPHPSSFSSSPPAASLWSAEWTAKGLEDKRYAILLRVVDAAGHPYEDASLNFSDPVAGFATIGTPHAPLAKDAQLDLTRGEEYIKCGVVDPEAGFAYFGTIPASDGSLAALLKIKLSDLSLVQIMPITQFGGATCSVIDVRGGYAYFGVAPIGSPVGNPVTVLKIRLADFTIAGQLALNTGEYWLISAAIDVDAGFAYFGTHSEPGIVVKIRLSDFTRVGAITLNTGEDNLRCAALDAAGGYLYFGTDRFTFTQPNYLVKIRLSDFKRVGALTLNAGEYGVNTVTIDPAGLFLYMALETSPGIVIKVRLSDFTRAGTITFGSEDIFPRAVGINAAGTYLYVSTNGTSNTNPSSRIQSIRLSDFTKYTVWPLQPDEFYPSASDVDLVHGDILIGTDTSPAHVVKVSMATGLGLRTDGVALAAGESKISTAVVDNAHGFAYLCTINTPSDLVKVRLSDFSRINALHFNTGEDYLNRSMIDVAGQMAYFASSDTIYKVGLAFFSRIGAPLAMIAGEKSIQCAVIDPQGGYGYLGLGVGKVIKIKLSNMTRVGSLTLNADEPSCPYAIMDPAGVFAYFLTSLSSKPAVGKHGASLVKVRLSDFSRVDALEFDNLEWSSKGAAIDPQGNFAYLRVIHSSDGTTSSRETLVKVRLSDFSRMETFDLDPGQSIECMTIDNTGAYVCALVLSPASDVLAERIRLADMTISGTISLGVDATSFRASFMDSANRAYFAHTSSPGMAIRINMAVDSGVLASRFTMPEWGTLGTARIYSHGTGGNVRLALYDDSHPTRHLLWQSKSKTNTIANNYIGFPADQVLSGAPIDAPLLSPGNYWLAWQTDLVGGMGSFTPGEAGDGFAFPQPYGPFPETINLGESKATGEKTTSGIIYNPAASNGVNSFWQIYP